MPASSQKRPNAKAHKGQANLQEKKKAPQAKTENGRIIQAIMKEQKVKGNYKDFVVLTPGGLLHWKGTYQLVRKDTGEQLETPAVALIHKRILSKMFGTEIGEQFWKKGGRTLAKL